MIPRADWHYDELARPCVLETTIRGQEIYQRGD